MSVQIVREAENLFKAIPERVYVQRIYKDLKANAPVYSGELKKSIRIEKTGKYKWVIAPHTDHDWYAEYGNHANSSDGLIHVKNAKAMSLKAKDGSVMAFRKAVRPHKGSHFVEKTANKYR